MRLFFVLLPGILLPAVFFTHLLVSYLLERRRARRAMGAPRGEDSWPKA